jgi:dTDP-4-dehydrorhamnose reductase
MQRILLLGGSGYVGEAFARELRARGTPFYVLSRKEADYTRFETLLEHLRANRPSFVINAAGYTGRPNVDACETARAETLLGNTLFPQALAQACLVAGIPYGHVSSGCIYSGAKLVENGQTRVERDLLKPEIRPLLEAPASAIKIVGFSESDIPNFSFRAPPCSFYSGSKALAEEVMQGVGDGYLWRLRIPFDEQDNPRNYLTKIQKYARVYDNYNSISHRGDFVRACLDLWERKAPFGTYNVTNPGFVSTRQVVDLIRKHLKPDRDFTFWESDAEFYKVAALAPRSNCIMDTTKLVSAGVSIRPVEEALEDSLKKWRGVHHSR